MKKSTFSAAAAIARQEAQIARGMEHYAAQQRRVECGDLIGYWRAELAWHDEHRPFLSEQREVAYEAIQKTIEALEDGE